MANNPTRNLHEIARTAASPTGSVMISNDPSVRRRHLRLLWDETGPYVRTGKGGRCKERIIGCHLVCRLVYGNLFEFQTEIDRTLTRELSK